MIRSELKDPLAAPLGATHPHCFRFCHCSSSRLNPSALDKALPHDGLAHLFQADRGSRTGIKTALVEKLAQEGRDNLRLEAVVVISHGLVQVKSVTQGELVPSASLGKRPSRSSLPD